MVTESYSYMFDCILGIELAAGIYFDTRNHPCYFLSFWVWVCLWLGYFKYLTPSSTDPYFFWGIFAWSSWPLQGTESYCIQGRRDDKLASPSAGSHISGISAGIVGGLLGLGGGFIMGPLFLELGVPPQVSLWFSWNTSYYSHTDTL